MLFLELIKCLFLTTQLNLFIRRCRLFLQCRHFSLCRLMLHCLSYSSPIWQLFDIYIFLKIFRHDSGHSFHSSFVSGHTMQNAPDPIRTPKNKLRRVWIVLSWVTRWEVLEMLLACLFRTKIHEFSIYVQLDVSLRIWSINTVAEHCISSRMTQHVPNAFYNIRSLRRAYFTKPSGLRYSMRSLEI